MPKSVKKVSKNVSILGTQELAKKIASLDPLLQTRTSRILHQGARQIAEDIKSSMALSPPSGATYGSHTASSAGNPPRIDTAELVNAVVTQPIQFSASVESTLVGVFKESGQADKAIWMEFGTNGRDGVGAIAPRPFARPAYFRNRTEILKNVRKALVGALKKL